MERCCGDCRECCQALAIPELEKPCFQTCAHMEAAGCSVYADRIQACRSYECLWLALGLGEERDRPDLLGLIFSEPDRTVFHPHSAHIHILCACEVSPDRASSGRAAEVLRLLSEKMVVVLTRVGKPTSLTGPGHMVTEVLRVATPG